MLRPAQSSKYIGILIFNYIIKYSSLENYLVDEKAIGDKYSLQAGNDRP